MVTGGGVVLRDRTQPVDYAVVAVITKMDKDIHGGESDISSTPFLQPKNLLTTKKIAPPSVAPTHGHLWTVLGFGTVNRLTEVN